nr:hypothetical protein [Tanacetum cinerariifolium]
MFYRVNVDYPKLIWEDFVFQIDHRKEKKSRRETMPFPRFTKVIINHFLSQHKYLSKIKFQHYHTIKDDGISKPKPAKKKTGSRSTRGVVIQDAPSAPKPKPATLNLKLKGVQSLTPEEQEIAYTMQTLKESKKTSRRQPGVPDEEKVTSEENVILEWGSEQESKYSEEDQGDDEKVDWIYSDEDEEKKDDDDDDKSIDLEMTNDEETEDEFVQGDEQVNDDEDEEMTNAEVEEFGNGDEENTDAAKANVEKTEELDDDAKKAKLPPTSSDITDVKINSLLDIKIQSEVPHIQSPSVVKVPVFVISKPSVLTSIPENPSVAQATTPLHQPSVSTIQPVLLQTATPIHTPPITTEAPTITTVVSESDALTVVQLRVTKLEKDVFELKKIDHSAEALATLKS